MNANTLNHIELTIMFVRSTGPVGKDEIASELLTQCVGCSTRDDANRLADSAIRHGLSAGWIERYDDEGSFVIA
jgi:hypothetical protein